MSNDQDFDRKAGAAVTGMFAAVVLCRELDIDPRELLKKVEELAIKKERGER